MTKTYTFNVEQTENYSKEFEVIAETEDTARLILESILEEEDISNMKNTFDGQHTEVTLTKIEE